MTDDMPKRNGASTDVLVRAVEAAGQAPSVHNTQPWHWRVGPDRLELSAVGERQLEGSDPHRRLLLLSCGIALHHARLVLAAEGVAVVVDRLPAEGDSELLARLVVTGSATPAAEAAQLVRCIPERHTDRRPVADQEVPAAALDAITAAARAEGGRLHLLRDDQVLDLAATAATAGTVGAADPQLADELRYWTGQAVAKGTGLPPGVLPDRMPASTVPARDFGRPGTLSVGAGHDRAARYALLYGDDDEPDNWLRAGEALSAAWLTATDQGVSLVPMSGVVEVSATRQVLRRVLANVGHPYLAMRLGMPDPAHAGPPPRTPRLPTDQIMDTD